MKTKLLAGLLLAGSAVFAGHFSIGIGIGAPYGYYPPAPPRVAYVPSPGPGYEWIDGSYYPVGAGWQWRAGYWTRPPYAGSFWVRPRYEDGRFYEGRWERRDFDRDRGRGYGNGFRR